MDIRNENENMDEILTYKCPCCGAPLKFSGEKQMLVCEFCNNEYKPEAISDYDVMQKQAADSESAEWKEYEAEEEETEVYICPSCGAEIVSDELTAASECAYCGNAVIMNKAVSGILKPDNIIPFKLDKAAAKAALRNLYRKKPLLPRSFIEENHIEKLRGMYVPFWLYSCRTRSKALYDARRVATWSDSNYFYTKTSFYSVMRDGIAGFERVPVDASSKLNDDYMDSLEPYDYSALVPFDSVYFTGFSADRYDVDSVAGAPRANDRIKQTMTEMLRSTMHGYSSVAQKSMASEIHEGKADYAMLPVWLLNTKYKDKLYNFAMNGQTGKMVGTLPVDKKRYWCFWLAAFGVLFALGQLLLLL